MITLIIVFFLPSDADDKSSPLDVASKSPFAPIGRMFSLRHKLMKREMGVSHTITKKNPITCTNSGPPERMRTKYCSHVMFETKKETKERREETDTTLIKGKVRRVVK